MTLISSFQCHYFPGLHCTNTYMKVTIKVGGMQKKGLKPLENDFGSTVKHDRADFFSIFLFYDLSDIFVFSPFTIMTIFLRFINFGCMIFEYSQIAIFSYLIMGISCVFPYRKLYYYVPVVHDFLNHQTS